MTPAVPITHPLRRTHGPSNHSLHLLHKIGSVENQPYVRQLRNVGLHLSPAKA